MKTRLTRGTTNKVFHWLFSKQKRKDYIWAMNLKPGDGINSYDAWNHTVKSIKIIWSSVPPRRLNFDNMSYGRCPGGTFVQDVDIFTTDGWVHSISETGCIEPAWSIEQIRHYFKSNVEVSTSVVDKMIEFGIVDKNGYRLRSATKEENDFIESFYNKVVNP